MASITRNQTLDRGPAGATREQRVAILYHPRVAESLHLADELVAVLRARGVKSLLHSAWDWHAIEPEIGDLDYVITLGGDGTVLRAARQTAAHGVPVIGVNFGVLGFLAEMDPEEALSRVPEMVSEGGRLEERLMLQCRAYVGGNESDPLDALNDVFVGRGAVAHAVRLELSVNGVPLTRFVADGVLVASPTGSTAYALSAGGPIVAPDLDVMIIAPVAPHPTAVRPLVLPGDAVIGIQVRRDQDAVLTLDGQEHRRLGSGDRVEVRRSPHVARFLRMGDEESFYRTLFERLKR